jgi:hypothetical protein
MLTLRQLSATCHLPPEPPICSVAGHTALPLFLTWLEVLILGRCILLHLYINENDSTTSVRNLSCLYCTQTTLQILFLCVASCCVCITNIYMTQVYTCYRNTVFYFDISHSLSSLHVSALWAIIG